MARVNNLTNFLTDVASAIKTKTGDSSSIPASQFDSKILAIPAQGSYQTKSIEITTNGNMTLLPDTGYDAIDRVNITTNIASTAKTYRTKPLLDADTPANNTYGIVTNYADVYDATIVQNIRNWCNQFYQREYGPNTHQDKNIVLYNLNDDKYYTIVHPNEQDEQEDYDSKWWRLRYVEELTVAVQGFHFVDPGYSWRSQYLYRYDTSGNSFTMTQVYMRWAIMFPRLPAINANFILIYCDTNVPNEDPNNHVLSYEGYNIGNGDNVPILNYYDGIYKFMNNSWIDVSAPLTHSQYSISQANVDAMLYGEEANNV